MDALCFLAGSGFEVGVIAGVLLAPDSAVDGIGLILDAGEAFLPWATVDGDHSTAVVEYPWFFGPEIVKQTVALGVVIDAIAELR